MQLVPGVNKNPSTLNIDVRDEVAAYNGGIDALTDGTAETAIPLITRAARLHPHQARLWQVLGLLHRQCEDSAAAIDNLRKAAQLAPSDARIAHALARAHLEAGLPSLDLFQAARALSPNDGDLLLGIAAARSVEQSAQVAISELDQLLARNPGWLPGHAAVAKLRWQSGDQENFATSFHSALAAHPADQALWRGLIVMLTEGDLYGDALAAVERGRRAVGSSLLFDANEAVCRAELCQFEMADQLFEKLARVNDPTLKLRQVRHLLRTGRARDAETLAAAMTQTPAAVLFWPYLSAAWRMTGDPRWNWLEGDPRLVGVYDLTESLPPLELLADRLRKLHLARNQPLEQSVRGGTQTDGALFARIEPEIRRLREVIAGAVERHLAQLPTFEPTHPLWVSRSGPLRFSGSWSVRLAAAGHHANHIHPAGRFSSALYVSIPQAAERGGDAAGWLSLGQPQAELGVDLPPTRMVEPKPGQLVLFPSTMWHGTVPFAAGERLTVAFDVAPPLDASPRT